MEKTFEKYFRESKGKPFNYMGKIIQISLKKPMDEGSRFRMENFRTNSEWRQGIVVRAVKGSLKFEEIVNTAFVFWQENFGDSIEVDFLQGEYLLIYNVWDTGFGMHHGHNGAGIHIEEDQDKITLNCNDAHPTAELNHLTFDLRIINK